MRRAIAWLCLAGSVAGFGARGSAAPPLYTPASIVNAATNRSGPLAPGTLASLYGEDLAYAARAMGPDDIRGGLLPTLLPGASVTVLVNSQPAVLYYVSPRQINLLIPSNLTPGHAVVEVVRSAVAGPRATISLAESSPGLFEVQPGWAVATHAAGNVVTREEPALPGEDIVLYATGLGRCLPEPRWREIPTGAAPLARLSEFAVHLAGTALPASAVRYAGIAPGFAGLYQINLKLPEDFPADPDVRIGLGSALSPEGVRLITSPAGPAPQTAPLP